MPRGMHPNSLKALEENRHRLNSETGAEAGKISGEKRMMRKTFRDQFASELEAMISQRDKDGNVIGEITVKDAITKQMVQKALKGNTRAFELIRDTIGEKPVETVQIVEPDFSELDSLDFNSNDSQ